MVLEARYKAEKIEYPVVGEKTKESSDVIDYDIRDEWTKDLSAEINANSQTTTGMATVIPGINAPKLIASTSIIGINPNDGYLGGAYFRFTASHNESIPGYETLSVDVERLTNTSRERGPYTFRYVLGSGIILPVQGTYSLECTFDWAGSVDGISGTLETFIGGELVHTSASTGGGDTETFNISGARGKGITFVANFKNNFSSVRYAGYIVSVTITKL